MTLIVRMKDVAEFRHVMDVARRGEEARRTEAVRYRGTFTH